MAVRQPRYSKEEFAQRGNQLYESSIRAQVEEGNHGRIVAIDIETGSFEIDDTPMVAVDRLYERCPEAQPWVIRIGHRAVFRMGSRIIPSPARSSIAPPTDSYPQSYAQEKPDVPPPVD